MQTNNKSLNPFLPAIPYSGCFSTKMKLIFCFITLLVISSNILFAQKIYTLDKNHAKVGFSVVHFGISHIEGDFKIFEATFKSTQPDFTDAVINFTTNVSSINTEVDYRDKDLRSSNYFDAEKYPTIYFKGSSFKKLAGNTYKLYGNITIHGITKFVSFNVVYNGEAITAMKKPTAGFTITGKINRLDFGVGGSVISTGISNEIDLRSNVEFTVTN